MEPDREDVNALDTSKLTADTKSTLEALGSESFISKDGAVDMTREDTDGRENQEIVFLNHELEILLDSKNNLSTPPPLISISPFECTKLQKEELETLKAIYGEDLRCLSESCFAVNIRYLAEDICDDDVIKVWFSLPPNYPAVPPVIELEACQSGVCSYSDADELYDCFVTESLKRIGEMMIFDLVTMAQEFMSSLVERKKRQAEEREAADRLWKEKIEAEEAAKKPTKIVSQKPPMDSASSSDIPMSSTGTVSNPLFDKVDTLLWSGMLLKPTHIIGRISEIVNKLPDNMQITRVENVLRQDLGQKFCQTLKEANEELWKKERQFPHEISLKPQIAFHGTLSSNLPSIVQRGLVIPGQRNDVRVRCGSSLGLGIYLSPSAQYSLGYSSSDRLIVCAALQGRIYKDDARKSKARKNRYCSVESCCGNEWVFFNAGQVLPCYVIQVQKCDPKKPQAPPLHALLVSNSSEDGSVRDKKAALLARARKFLPYGFGPGSNTIIEEAASFDDDEEDYGEYQECRQAETGFELQKYRYK